MSSEGIIGTKYKRTSRVISPGTRGDERIWKTAERPSIAMGPKIYIPARIHPHLGAFFVLIELATQREAIPAKGRIIAVRRPQRPRGTSTIETADGSQKHMPPNAIQ
jgi:hypothetical protein